MDELMEKTEVAVISDTRYEGCRSGGWGPRWSQSEITEIVAQYLKRMYGDTVSTRYLDMADEETRSEYPEFAKAVDVNRWSLPLVAIDGKVWFTGYVDHRSIVGVIEKKRAASQSEQSA